MCAAVAKSRAAPTRAAVPARHRSMANTLPAVALERHSGLAMALESKLLEPGWAANDITTITTMVVGIPTRSFSINAFLRPSCVACGSHGRQRTLERASRRPKLSAELVTVHSNRDGSRLRAYRPYNGD